MMTVLQIIIRMRENKFPCHNIGCICNWLSHMYVCRGSLFKYHPMLSLLLNKVQSDSLLYLCGRIKGFNSAIYAIKCQQVVTELWLGSYSTVVG